MIVIGLKVIFQIILCVASDTVGLAIARPTATTGMNLSGSLSGCIRYIAKRWPYIGGSQIQEEPRIGEMCGATLRGRQD